MVADLKIICDRIDLMTIVILVLLFVLVFTINKRNEAGIDDWLRAKRTNVISCTPYRSVKDHHSAPTGDNSGTGCMHQSVVAALPGQHRVKRGAMHNC